MYSELHCEMRGNLHVLNAKQVSEEWALFKFSLFIVHSILKQSTKLWKQSEHLSKLKAILCSCFYSLLKGLASFYTASAEPSQTPLPLVKWEWPNTVTTLWPLPFTSYQGGENYSSGHALIWSVWIFWEHVIFHSSKKV